MYMITLTDKEFLDIVQFVKSNYGIDLTKKRSLIEARMFSVLQEKGLTSFSQYFELIKKKDSLEITAMINKLTTNHTYFLRESAHFDFLKQIILPGITRDSNRREIRIWSAGCSSGEEAYTTVMTIEEFLGLKKNQWDYRLLATDISHRVMNKAMEGIYSPESLEKLPAAWQTRYFTKQTDGNYLLKPEIRDQVIFKYFNLMDRFPYGKPFDVIFCRNVMIYFDQDTKNALIQKFYEVLKPGGYLFIGHSETVRRDKTPFEYIQPSIYRKGGYTA